MATRHLLEPRCLYLPKRSPLLAQQLRDGDPPILDPGPQLTARLLDRARPIRKTTGRPGADRRQGKAKRFRPVEQNVREREHIGWPLQQLICHRKPSDGLPGRHQRRLTRPWIGQPAHTLCRRSCPKRSPTDLGWIRVAATMPILFFGHLPRYEASDPPGDHGRPQPIGPGVPARRPLEEGSQWREPQVEGRSGSCAAHHSGGTIRIASSNELRSRDSASCAIATRLSRSHSSSTGPLA